MLPPGLHHATTADAFGLINNDGDGGCSFLAAYTGGPMAQVRGLGPRVGGRLALFCIHRVNRVYGALVVTSWTRYGAL